MLDRHLHPRIKPLLHQCVRVLDKPGITPDGLTLVGFAIGVLALPFLALGWYLAALVVILLNRLLDGLDGALARRRGLTDAGGFLDISLDRIVRHIVGLCLCDNVTQPAVVCRIGAAAFLDSHRQFPADLGKDLSFCSIIFFFLMLYIGKF